MDNLNDLKQLWQTADTGNLPGSAEILRMVKQFRNKKLSKKFRIIGMAFLSAAVMGFAMFFAHPKMLTTYLGTGLLIAACGVMIFTNVRSLKRFYRLDDCSNKEFIEFLEQTRLNQIYFYKKTQVAGLTLSSTGLLLYLYEMVHNNLVTLLLTYGLALVYITILIFVVRPRRFKKEAKKLSDTIDRLQTLSKQIEEI